MSRKIWTKPFVKSILFGDRDEARKLERKARACVGYLFDQLTPNQKYRSQNWSYADGSKITAHVWRDVLGERARVEIFAPSGKRTYLIMLSGMYHGWHTDAYVFVPSEIVEYYLSAGSLLPGSSNRQHICGPTSTVADIGVPPTWAAVPPLLDARQAHESPYRKADLPELYTPIWEWTATGRMRLLAQAFQGVKRDLRLFLLDTAHAISSSCQILHGVGLVHSPRGDLWLTSLSSVGLVMTKLKIWEPMIPVMEWIVNGELNTELDERLLLSYIYATCEIALDNDNNPVVVNVADANDLVDVYPAGSGAYILANSWHWHPTDAKAAAVVGYAKDIYDGGKYVRTFQSAVAQVAIQWDEETDDPIGVDVSVNGWYDLVPDYTSHGAFWYRPCIGFLHWWPGESTQADPPWYEFISGDSPLYCMWNSDGTLREYWYQAYKYDNDRDDSVETGGSWPKVCGTSVDEEAYKWDSSTVVSGGFLFHDLPSEMVLGQYEKIRRKWTLGGDGEWAAYPTTWSESNKDLLISNLKPWIGWSDSGSLSGQCCNPAALQWIEGQEGYSTSGLQVKGKLVDSAEEITTFVTGGDEKQKFFVTNDPQVVMSVHRRQATTLRTITNTYVSNGRYLATTIRAYIGVWNGSSYDYTYGSESPVCNTWLVGASLSNYDQRAYYCTTQVSNNVEYTTSEFGEAIVTVETPHERKIRNFPGGYGDWSCSDVRPWDSYLPPCALNAAMSHGGALIHVWKPGSDYVCDANDNIPNALNISYDIGWIGAA